MQIKDSIEHNEMFDLAYRFVTETGENIFLTGKAGTGKTTFLKYLVEKGAKNMVITAPTGVAAINAGGVTLHSLFQIPPGPFIPTKNNRDELLSKIRYNKSRHQLLRKIQLLVIDEISMVRCDVLDAIDTILKSVKRNYDLPFGGVQLLCIGDLYQLPPVARRDEWDILREYYSSTFFFDSLVIKHKLPLLIELDKIYRQKEDTFIALLNKIRCNTMNPDDFEKLHVRHNPVFTPAADDNYITLTSHNNQANLINAGKLQNLSGNSYTYDAILKDDFPESSYPAESTLDLKVGAQVMFLKNDTVQKRYFNGKIGIIKSLSEEEIVVACAGINIYVAQETWENTRYVIDKTQNQLQQEIMGTFTQFPLRLAWAITIHKSQGLTFEKVLIDAGLAFSSGQVYVALSRCTTLNGIVLLSKIPAAAILCDNKVIKAQQVLTHKGSLADRFDAARQHFTGQLLNEIFSFSEVIEWVQKLSLIIAEHQSKLNIEAMAWIYSLRDGLQTDKQTGSRFLSQVAQLINDDIIEHNFTLQKRINDAACYFELKFAAYQLSLQDHPLIAQHRETATSINKHLNQLMAAVYTTKYLLQYCIQPFSITSFLQHKLKLSYAPFGLSCLAGDANQSYSDIPNAELYQLLKSWRDAICEDAEVPVYMVANHMSLMEVASYLPLEKPALMKLTGFGKVKVDKYGDHIIKMVKEYCAEKNLDTNIACKEPKIKKSHAGNGDEPKTYTKKLSFSLFIEGKSIAEIAKTRNLTAATIEGHLEWYVGNGQVDVGSLVTPAKQSVIKDAIEIHGRSSYKLLKDSVPENISYGDIRFVLASGKKQVVFT